MEIGFLLGGASISVIPPLIVLVIVFRISKEMTQGIFERFFKLLELAFSVIMAEGIAFSLALAYGISSPPNPAPLLALPVFMSLTSYTLLALAFVLLYIDWRREPVAGLDGEIKIELRSLAGDDNRRIRTRM